MNPDSRKDQEGAELLRAGVTGGSLQKQYTLLTTQLFLYHHHPQKKIFIYYVCIHLFESKHACESAQRQRPGQAPSVLFHPCLSIPLT